MQRFKDKLSRVCMKLLQERRGGGILKQTCSEQIINVGCHGPLTPREHSEDTPTMSEMRTGQNPTYTMYFLHRHMITLNL